MVSAGQTGMRARATEKRRADILAAALECFRKEGVSATTIEDIRQASGASIGSIYHHFSSKEEIIEALHSDAMARYEQRFFEHLHSGDPQEGLRRAIGFHFKWTQQLPVLAGLGLERSLAEPSVSSEGIAHAYSRFEARLLAWLDALKEQGTVRPMAPDIYVAIIMGPCIELSRHLIAGRIAINRRALNELADAIWQALRSETPEAKVGVGRAPARKVRPS
jgi:AcrR family transcriptional regulator